MAELTREQRLGEIAALRIKIKTNSVLRQDVSSAIIDALKKHGITLTSELQSDIILALSDEIDGQLSDVVLPGGTNC